MKDLLPEILVDLLPQQNITKKINVVVGKLENAIEKLTIEATVMIGGSVAKNTYLNNAHDCDIFIRFARSYENDQLSELLQSILERTKIAFERIHGSRDYFQLTVDGIDYEIVPVYYIEDASSHVNVTDCSPLHIQWVTSHAKMEIQGIPLYNHIRIAKAFCRSQRVYGAESYIGGFSGHVLDILIIHYGGFNQFIEHVSNWKRKTIVDPESFYADDKQVLRAINDAKSVSPLIVIDPIDKTRNASAALSKEKYELLIQVCKAYKEYPAAGFFRTQQLNAQNWRAPSNEVVQLSMKPVEGKNDVSGAKMKKATQYIVNQLSSYGFIVEDQEFWWDTQNDAVFLMHISQQKIPSSYIHRGPPLELKDDLAQFKEKHPEAYEENDFIVVKMQRSLTTVQAFLKQLFSKPYITQRCSDIKFVSFQ